MKNGLTTLRKKNMAKILTLLSKNAYSSTELSKLTGLSSTGVFTILDEMVERNMLYKTDDLESTSIGRRPILYNITRGCGLICVIDFCLLKRMSLYSFGREEIFSYDFEDTAYGEKFFRGLIEILREQLEKFAIPLININVAITGAVDHDSGKLLFAPAFSDYKNFNIKKMFEDAFSVPVYIKNDLKYALIAEKGFGQLGDKICNTLYLQLGLGFGSALYLNNKLFEGSRGRNSEVGSFEMDCFHKSFFCEDEENTKFYYLCSYYNIVNQVQRQLKMGRSSSVSGRGEITIEAIVEAFEEGDPLCSEILLATARMTAKMIKSLVLVIDFENIVISRLNYKFGQKYFECISQFVNSEPENVAVDFYMASYVAEDAVLRGALRSGIEYGINRIIE